MNVDDGAFHALASIFKLKNLSYWNIVSINSNQSYFVPNEYFNGLTKEQLWTGFYEMAKLDMARVN